MHWFRSINVCNNMLFPEVIKSVFILVQWNTSLSTKYVAQSVTVVCEMVEYETKTGLSVLSAHMKSVVEQGFSSQICI